MLDADVHLHCIGSVIIRIDQSAASAQVGIEQRGNSSRRIVRRQLCVCSLEQCLCLLHKGQSLADRNQCSAVFEAVVESRSTNIGATGGEVEERRTVSWIDYLWTSSVIHLNVIAESRRQLQDAIT